MTEINGTVTREGEPAGSVYVRLIGPSSEFVAERYTGDDGQFTFHVGPGTWTLEARAPGVETQLQKVDVADAAVRANIALEKFR